MEAAKRASSLFAPASGRPAEPPSRPHRPASFQTNRRWEYFRKVEPPSVCCRDAPRSCRRSIEERPTNAGRRSRRSSIHHELLLAETQVSARRRTAIPSISAHRECSSPTPQALAHRRPTVAARAGTLKKGSRDHPRASAESARQISSETGRPVPTRAGPDPNRDRLRTPEIWGTNSEIALRGGLCY